MFYTYLQLGSLENGVTLYILVRNHLSLTSLVIVYQTVYETCVPHPFRDMSLRRIIVYKYRKISNMRRTKYLKLKGITCRLAVVFA